MRFHKRGLRLARLEDAGDCDSPRRRDDALEAGINAHSIVMGSEYVVDGEFVCAVQFIRLNSGDPLMATSPHQADELLRSALRRNVPWGLERQKERASVS
jgi:hypothetical protein